MATDILSGQVRQFERQRTIRRETDPVTRSTVFYAEAPETRDTAINRLIAENCRVEDIDFADVDLSVRLNADSFPGLSSREVAAATARRLSVALAAIADRIQPPRRPTVIVSTHPIA